MAAQIDTAPPLRLLEHLAADKRQSDDQIFPPYPLIPIFKRLAAPSLASAWRALRRTKIVTLEEDARFDQFDLKYGIHEAVLWDITLLMIAASSERDAWERLPGEERREKIHATKAAARNFVDGLASIGADQLSVLAGLPTEFWRRIVVDLLEQLSSDRCAQIDRDSSASDEVLNHLFALQEAVRIDDLAETLSWRYSKSEIATFNREFPDLALRSRIAYVCDGLDRLPLADRDVPYPRTDRAPSIRFVRVVGRRIKLHYGKSLNSTITKFHNVLIEPEIDSSEVKEWLKGHI